MNTSVTISKLDYERIQAWLRDIHAVVNVLLTDKIITDYAHLLLVAPLADITITLRDAEQPAAVPQN